MPTVDISWMGILWATIANMVIGAAWFGIFAGPWAKEAGMKKDDMKDAGMGYLYSAIAAVVMAYVLSHFIDYAMADDWMKGMQVGFWAWLGFVATATASETIWQKKSWTLWLLNNGNYVITLMVMGAILAMN